MAIVFRDIEKAVLRMETAINDVIVRPRVEDVAISFNEDGRSFITIRCNADTLTVRYAVSSEAFPDPETVAAEAVLDGPTHDITLAGPFSAGATLYVSVLAYAGPAGDGDVSPLYTAAATRGEIFYHECRAIILATTDTTLTVQVFGASVIGKVAVRLESLTGSATLDSGLAVGVVGNSPQTYVFARPAAGSGESTAVFLATFPDAVDDRDRLIIPEQDVAPLLFLAMRATPLASTPTTMSARVSVADPFPQGVDSVRVTATASGGAGVTPAFVDLSPGAVFSGEDDTFADFAITRPAYDGVDGQILFRVESLVGYRVPDEDAILVPKRESMPPWLEITETPGDEEWVITWDGGPEVDLSINGGSFRAASASPITVIRGAASGGSDQTYVFRAEGVVEGETTTVTQTVFIPKKAAPVAGLPTISGVTPFINSQPGDGGGDFDVNWSEVNMPGGQTYTIEYTITAGGVGTLIAGPFTVDPASKPQNIIHALGAPDVAGVVTVRAYSGASLIAESTYTGIFAF